MKFRCDRQRFLEAIQVVGAVITARAIKPIYESVKIISRDDGLELLATDLEVAIRYQLDGVDISEPGSLTVPVQRLSAILREIDDENIEIVWSNQVCEITAEGSRFKVLGENPEDFPEIPDFDEVGVFAIPKETFIQLVSKTGFAAAREKARFALNGIQISLKGDEVTCVATDGRRLALMTGTVENPDGVERSGIVPTKGMSQMMRVLTEGDEVIRVNLGPSLCLARTRRAVISSRLVEGAYPPVKEVIPVNSANRVEIDRQVFMTALRKAKILTTKESRIVRLGFSTNRLVIDAQSVEVGEAHVEFEIDYDGDDVCIGFNPEYLLEGLNATDCERIIFEFSAPNSPGLMTDGTGFTYVVSPVSLE